ncbi:acetyl-CoA carboxylase biotin carboxylase subunit [Noviherbaspirillum sp. Root189]|uniref:acetyl-CoA carboxylase biotin carboxylase subunit n=1 Tax=Noviherbaspirillum sp. Root189 TaxID=1736487 RepID=UPI000709A872|nr:biotin carboxylase N-terminal domain-containing protein [Noviherbaspirillum sp. Root189]KRB67941.1 biotin carboxylase [Noviherbaspirillum sp. Root189]
MKKVLIANRGAAATRILRATQALGLEAVIVYSDADADLPYVREARESYCLGPSPASHSYLNQDAILDCMRRSGADALHPGYGFLSENSAFARRIEEAGYCFIGPSSKWLEVLGHKASAREFVRKYGLELGASTPVLPKHDLDAVRAAAKNLGYPVLIKPAGGGGGIGMVPVHGEAELEAGWHKANQLAEKAFSDSSLYLERYVKSPRHIEFQFLADRHGNVISLFERDCSTQRRYQKVIEESPAFALDRSAVNAMADKLRGVLSEVGYDVIGTVEMLYTPETGFSFLEINTRLQVEHAVTEAVTGVDLVQAQIRLAAGEPLSAVIQKAPEVNGHAIEARIYAEDPVRFFPSPGVLNEFDFPHGMPGIRIETGYAQGNTVTSFYDPMVAKIVAWGRDRTEAIARLQGALAATRIQGIKTNIPMISRVLASAVFAAGGMKVDGLSAVLNEQAMPKVETTKENVAI